MVINYFFNLTRYILSFLILDDYIKFHCHDYNYKKAFKYKTIFIGLNFFFEFIDNLTIFTTDLLSIIIDFIYIFIITKDNYKNKIILFIEYLIFNLLAMFLIYILHSFVTTDFTYAQQNMLYKSYKRITCTFLIYVALTIYINIKSQRYNPKERKTVMGFNLLILFLSLFISVVPLVLKLESEKAQNFLLITFTLLMLIILIMLNLHKKLLEVLHENLQTKVALEANKLKQEYSECLTDNIVHLRKLRHDMNNHLVIIKGYANQNNTDRIIRYINHLTESLKEQNVIATPSEFLSSILNQKYLICKEKQITFHFKQQFQELYCEDFDLITIVGNMLDNAIEAAERCEPGVIDLHIYQQHSYLFIKCENNYAGEIREENGRFLSTKQDPLKEHGYGIENIRHAVKRLNGTVQINYHDHTFCMTIALPNYR